MLKCYDIQREERGVLSSFVSWSISGVFKHRNTVLFRLVPDTMRRECEKTK